MLKILGSATAGHRKRDAPIQHRLSPFNRFVVIYFTFLQSNSPQFHIVFFSPIKNPLRGLITVFLHKTFTIYPQWRS